MIASRILRRTSALVLITFTSLTMQPLQAAMQLPKVERTKPAAASPDEKFSRALADIHELLKQLAPAAAMPASFTGKQKDVRAIGPNMKIIVEENIKPMPGVNVSDKMKELRAKLKEIGDYSKAAEQSFIDVEKHLKDKKLPAEIFNRHAAAVKEYQTRKTEFETLSQAVIAADNKALPGSLAALGIFFAKYPNEKTHTPTDPNKLPWRTPDSKVRKPFETEKAFKTSLFKEPRTHLAGPIPWGLTLPATNLPATPVAADLAPTEDVQITPAIQALADSLNKSPVKIHNWVRNNIEFLPTYGSIQGADMTLQTKRGNAFDTASLLIGLLRASGIPARYVYGTIEVPTDKAMNWVGGVTKPEAAQSLLGQGGIPNIGVIAGGTMRSIKLEHVWVEAWVDYVPSRGAINKVGDTWVKMDASFKQYTYAQGIDIKSAVPLDANALITQAQAGATVNQTEGWVQNLNQANIQTALANYQNQVKTYIDTAKPNATVGEVLGTKTIQLHNYSFLLGTLPYKTIATGGKFNALPDMVRHQFQYNLYASNYDVALENPFLSFKQSLPKLAGKKITLSFAPASQADIDLINSYLPKAHVDGTPIQLSELPPFLPGYLIHVISELRVDGQVVASSGNFTVGSELASSIAMFDPVRGWESGESNKPIAGEYHAIALDLQGIGAQQLINLKQKIEQTKALLQLSQANPGDLTLTQNLTKDDLTGDLLYSGILSYFASVDTSDQLTAWAGKQVITYRMPSYGAFKATAIPLYWFGIAKSVSFPGVNMDVDRLVYQTEARNTDQAQRNIFLRQAGSAGSTFEHAVPEWLFADRTKALNDPSQPQGVSAVKAIAVASAQGQKVYTFNTKNQSYHATILAQIQIDPDARQEILYALAAGKEVSTHAAKINISGWVGNGYTILDPNTGVGAYKISGGQNGGWLATISAGLSGLVDALTKKLRDPNAVNGPLNELNRSYWLSTLAKATTLLTFVKGVVDILSDNTLSPAKQIAQIIALTIFTAAANVGAAWLGFFFASPITAAALAITLVVVLAFINTWVNEQIREVEI